MMNRQKEYWNSAAASAVFTHPLDVALLRRHVGASGRILDFGCGYGRLLCELKQQGFRNLAGLDSSEAMVRRARRLVPGVPISVCGAPPTPHRDAAFDAILLFAVLTCIPRDDDQRALMAEMLRLLAPGGVIYASDFLLHADRRNRERYRAQQDRFGRYGVFEVEGGAVLRHHDPTWIRELFDSFESVLFEAFPATTMRGNPATGFRFVGRRPGLPTASVGL
jgi:SAM-dependent methyltransferase